MNPKTETNSIEGNEFYNYLVSVSKSDIVRGLNFNYCSADEFDGLCNNMTSNIELSIFHLNIRSLNKNSSELFQFLQSFKLDFDILVLSEIWSYNVDLYSTLFAGYSFYYDLPLFGSVGGVGIYVKNTIRHNRLDTLKIPSTCDCSVENIWLEISTNWRDI